MEPQFSSPSSWSNPQNRVFMVGAALVACMIVWFSFKWYRQQQADRMAKNKPQTGGKPTGATTLPNPPGQTPIVLPDQPPTGTGGFSTTKFKDICEKLRKVATEGTWSTESMRCEICKTIRAMMVPELQALHNYYISNYGHNLRVEIEAWKSSGCSWVPTGWVTDSNYDDTIQSISILST